MSERAYLIETFKALDRNGNGIVERVELEAVLKESGFSRAEAEQLIREVDLNGDGKISLEEFLKGFTVAN